MASRIADLHGLPEAAAVGWSCYGSDSRQGNSRRRRTRTAAIEVGIADGTMRVDIPAATIAHLTLSLMDGLQLQWLAGEGSLDMAGESEAYVEHLKGPGASTAD